MENKRVILTGAGGGIGSQLAAQLANAGARLLLVDLNEQALVDRQQALGPERVHTVCADITTAEARERIVSEALRHLGGIDILINSAGINPFGAFEQQPAELVRRTLEINTLAPMLLTHAVLPTLLEQGSGQIVNVGSAFGSIGFAWFSAYSASKFALRGFSQALRRELADTGVDVTYVAPRAVRTGINSQQVYDMAKAVSMNFDEPEPVARRILEAVRSRRKECYIGFPESLFVRINGLLPGLVDRALRKQDRRARAFAVRAG
ncbi:MAG TPA: SDR family oxidoreductase [Gammaproteobacteria bacterium]|nr:SDR family oxidoreductase [Gammaproteobacteria bacterium]